ncbi:MAG: hypothetical protein Q7J68_08215 [Thermoplasmata archaeon]|nr:hypothetical protein [Thermoplasmata archaeon]
MEFKRLMSIAIVFAMVAVSFAMVAPQNAKAGFIEILGPADLPWGTAFTPKDVTWDNTGKYCVVVGKQTSADFNAWVYSGYTDAWQGISTPTNSQILFSVTWDNKTGQFWFCGDKTGSPTDTIYFMPRDGNAATAAPGASKPITAMSAIEADDMGNVLVGESLVVGSKMHAYNKSDNKWFTYALPTTPTVWSAINSTSFNTVDDRFYIAAYNKIGSRAGVLYSDIAPLGSGFTIKETVTSLNIPNLYSIDWNPGKNYGLAVGDGVYTVRAHNATHLTWKVIEDSSTPNIYYDVAWDSDGWNEAGIFGKNATKGVYYRYYDSNPTMILGHTDATEPTYYCGAIKPPASPKFVFIPTSSGGVVAHIQLSDQSTTITANAVFPKLYWIGFNDTDAAFTSRLDQQVAPDSNYWFTLLANYTEGWTECEVVVEAWYDDGKIGGGAPETAYPAVDDTTRNLAFRLTWRAGTANAVVYYPNTPELEVTTGLVTDIDMNTPYASGDLRNNHTVRIPVWLGNQIRSADGSGWGSGDAAYGPLKTDSLRDANSWDFSITVRDWDSITAANTSYGEFGVNEEVSVLVSGNPSGNAPPGTINNVMTTHSHISYSANTDYYVNVSVPHLHENGANTTGNWIWAQNVSVHNMCPNATAANSDIDLQAYFTGEDVPLYVWGQTVTPITPPNNGTNATGPNITNYIGPIWGVFTFTELEWWVTVQAGTKEGIYWGAITISIETA